MKHTTFFIFLLMTSPSTILCMETNDYPKANKPNQYTETEWYQRERHHNDLIKLLEKQHARENENFTQLLLAQWLMSHNESVLPILTIEQLDQLQQFQDRYQWLEKDINEETKLRKVEKEKPKKTSSLKNLLKK